MLTDPNPLCRCSIMPWHAHELLKIPNLLSLSRVALTPVVGYFLARGDSQSTVICIVLLAIAGITDGLDGLLARRMNLTSDLGRLLDPLADKLMAAALIVLLVFYRDFPVWLGAVIIGRDVVIVLAGSLLLGGKKIVLGSNITGKYTFTAIAVLLGSYVIRFPFGIAVTTWLTVGLVALSTVFYARVFLAVKKGEAPPAFHDRPLYAGLRIGGLLLFIGVFLYELFLWLNL